MNGFDFEGYGRERLKFDFKENITQNYLAFNWHSKFSFKANIQKKL